MKGCQLDTCTRDKHGNDIPKKKFPLPVDLHKVTEGIWPCRNVLFAGAKDMRHPGSCNASAAIWCEYALKRKYESDPHDRKDMVKKVVKVFENHTPKVGETKNSQELYDQIAKKTADAMKTSIRDTGLNLIPKEGPEIGDYEEVLKALGTKQRPVVLMFWNSGHYTGTAFVKNNGIYHYDNDVGLCKCDNAQAWVEYAEWCDRCMRCEKGFPTHKAWERYSQAKAQVVWMSFERSS